MMFVKVKKQRSIPLRCFHFGGRFLSGEIPAKAAGGELKR
jgi:hypothetical protein